MDTETVNLPLTLRDLDHHLRTPLTVILGNIYFLSEEYLTPQQKAYLSDISESAEQLLKLANLLSNNAQKIFGEVTDNKFGKTNYRGDINVCQR